MCAEAAATLDSLWRGGLLFQGRAGLSDVMPAPPGEPRGGRHEAQTYRVWITNLSRRQYVKAIHVDEDVLHAVADGKTLNGLAMTEDVLANIFLHEAFHYLGHDHTGENGPVYSTAPFSKANPGATACR